jgi:hypothetical protein
MKSGDAMRKIPTSSPIAVNGSHLRHRDVSDCSFR